MAKKQKYEQLANQIIDLIGGKENVTFFTHCVTRLRFNLKDKSLVQKEAIENIEGVMGSQWQNDQYQIIIGQAVGDAYDLICTKTGLGGENTLDEEETSTKKKLSLSLVFGNILDGISGCLTPIIPALIGCGMIKVIVLCITTFSWLPTDSGTNQILTIVGDAGFYFLPILVGANAAKKFGANPSLGMVIGAILVYPTFVNGVTDGTAFDIFGIPVYGASYTSSIFPAILCVWIMSYIEKFFARISPDSLRSIVEPLCTLLVMIPLSFCLLAPAGAFLGNYVSAAVIWLYNTVGFLGVGVLAALMPFLIMTGMHSAFVPYLMQMFSTVGYEPIFFTSLVISNINQGISALAVGIKTKNKTVRSTSISCAITALSAGVTEPAMYGVNFKYKTPLYAAMIGSLCGGLFAGIMNVYIYAFAGASSFVALPCFIGGTSGLTNMILMCVAIAIGCIVTFIATLFLYKENEEG
ncbi:MAG: PTS transporter subunit EIIC [Faecalicoccus sp.]|uniref:PTS transporter subunit EIIC n=1 Tax=unclassified Faecalicoccus TaxID=2643311 RepID=UPI0025D96EC4|nr:PTS transporter subunit EIIC [Faecalicoccus sp.]MCI6379507.1 PTS transporter subunit EIIC [Erysipelotrichaceae bacterium]MDY4869640.1 PTS transporter subunit EIIC [Faecalicoccus sp.]